MTTNSDTVGVTVDGVEHQILRGASETTLPDGRVLHLQWGEGKPERLVHHEVVPGPTPRAARLCDRTSRVLRTLIEAASQEVIAAQIASVETYTDAKDEAAREAATALLRLTRNTYEYLVAELAAYVVHGTDPRESLEDQAHLMRKHHLSLADAAERARSRVVAALA